MTGRNRSAALVLLFMIVALFAACGKDTSTGPGSSGSVSGTYVLQPPTDSIRIELFTSYSMYRFLSQDNTYPQSTSIDSTGTWKKSGNTIEFLPHIRVNTAGNIFQPPAFTGTIEGSTLTLNGKQYTRR